jgi:hypothetical protein
MLLQSRLQALVDQLRGISEMMRAGMADVAFGDLGEHLRKCSEAGQRALDAYAEFHGPAPDLVYATSVVEFMREVR